MILWLPIGLALAYFGGGFLIASAEVYKTPLREIVDVVDPDFPDWGEAVVKGVMRIVFCMAASVGFTLAYIAVRISLGL